MNGVAHSLRASLPNADSLDLPSHSVLSNGGGEKAAELEIAKPGNHHPVWIIICHISQVDCLSYNVH